MATSLSVPTKRLNAAILTTDATFTLNNILSWDGLVDGTTKLQSSDFGSVGYGVFRNTTNTQIEFFTFDPTTIANSVITILTRGCDFKGGTTDNVKPKYNWPANSTLVDLGANVPSLFAQYVGLSNNNTFTGTNTFGINPVKGAATLAPTNDSYITKNDLLNAVLGSVNTNQLTILGTAGEALTKGWAVYQKVSDGKWYGTVSSASATSEAVLLGIAQAAASINGSVNILLLGEDTNQSGLVTGSLYYLQDTKGTIGTSAGTKSVVIGQAKSSTNLLVNSRFTQIPTGPQALALVGDDTSIPIGSGNLVVTQTGLQRQTENYAVTSGVANTYAATLSVAPNALTAGFVLHLKFNVANTGTSTLAVNGGSAFTIKKQTTAGVFSDVVANDILANSTHSLIYDLTNTTWQLQSPVANAQSSSSVINTGTIAVAGNVDMAVTTGFRPQSITLYYQMQGTNSGAQKFSNGVATYDKLANLVGNFVFSQNAANLTSVAFAVGTTTPTVGALVVNDIAVTISVNSISTTGFTVRAVFTSIGTVPNGYVSILALAST